jgi:hypothetical protein
MNRKAKINLPDGFQMKDCEAFRENCGKGAVLSKGRFMGSTRGVLKPPRDQA